MPSSFLQILQEKKIEMCPPVTRLHWRLLHYFPPPAPGLGQASKAGEQDNQTSPDIDHIQLDLSFWESEVKLFG